MGLKKQFFIFLFISIIAILFAGNCLAGNCLGTQSDIGEPRVRTIRNNTLLTIEVPYFYNGCQGNNVTLEAVLLDLHQRGGVASSGRTKIGHTLGANRVDLKLQTPMMPFDGESHKIVIVMMAPMGGNSVRMISQKEFEYKPRHLEQSNKQSDYQDRRNRMDENRYGSHTSNNSKALKSKTPDLRIISVRQYPPNVVPKSKRIFFEVQIENRGEGPCRSAIRVKGPDGVQGTIDPLGPGQTQSVRFPFNTHASGPGRTTIRGIYFQVDPDNHIPESNETNNSAGPFTVVMN
jgi:hypothetical protein